MQTNFLRRRGARGLSLALLVAVGLAGATPAFADHDHWDHDRGEHRGWDHDRGNHHGWDHDRWHHGGGYWSGGVWIQPGYAPPPVVYAPAPVYAPPPVIYSPGVTFGMQIR